MHCMANWISAVAIQSTKYYSAIPRDATLVKLFLAHVVRPSFAVESASFARIASRGRHGANLFRPISFAKKE